MPFLRVVRDKRGYETTYLMHWQREGNRQHSKILYVFRTPGGIHVGREPLEPDVLKQIEAQHPEIAFDWGAVFHNKQIVETSTEPRRPRKRTPAEASAEAPAGVPPPAPQQPVQQQQPARPPIPATIEGATPDEQIAFLARWYAVVSERIPHRVADPARQEVLLALAERLNPAAWIDADQITAGLEQAGEALERLSHVFAKRRRRSKKRSGGSGSSTGAGNAGASSDTPVALGAEDLAEGAESPDDSAESASDAAVDEALSEMFDADVSVEIVEVSAAGIAADIDAAVEAEADATTDVEAGAAPDSNPSDSSDPVDPGDPVDPT